MPEYNRRSFLGLSFKGLMIAGIAGTANELLVACSPSKKTSTQTLFHTNMQQSPLPYAYSALEDVIDTQTMEIHYQRHAAGYAKALQEEAKVAGLSSDTSVEKILEKISSYSTKMRNNAGGHYNHELFWKCMRPKRNNNKPEGELAARIDSTFQSFENFKLEFTTASTSRFGSGWAWLYVDKNKTLRIGSTPNQDNPLMNVSDIKGTPLLGLDVWEHAYYLKYQNKRADYIARWWEVVNWEYVSQRYNAIMKS
jgi:Fe-Mn family superoxide dismutase